MNALKIALQFLTRLPVSNTDYNDADVKASIYWYGVVGLIIGAVLMLASGLLYQLAPNLDALIVATLLLCLWVVLTGALHLDGLADSADAWLGGNDKERTLAIMKDPRCGPAGVTSIVLVMLVKLACLNVLVLQSSFLLLLAPALSRCTIPLLFLITPYVRDNGLAAPFKDGLSQQSAYLQATLMALLCFVILGTSSVTVVLMVVGAFFWLRNLMLKRLAGTTGDTAGASIEILEATVLLGIALTLT